ncbi:MAG: hypothetical protein ABI137_14175 [Antricoccus sp.]
MTALIIGVALMIAALAVFHFANRFRGVEATGVVRGGLTVAAASSGDASLDDYAGYGIFKVDYTIDGVDHTGLILGQLATGRQVTIVAPTDGSPFTQLQFADSAISKALSWLSMFFGAFLASIGAWWVVAPIRDRSRRIKEHVRRQYGLPTIEQERELKSQRQSLPPPSPQFPTTTGVAIPVDRPQVPENYFTKPYDI